MRPRTADSTPREMATPGSSGFKSLFRTGSTSKFSLNSPPSPKSRSRPSTSTDSGSRIPLIPSLLPRKSSSRRPSTSDNFSSTYPSSTSRSYPMTSRNVSNSSNTSNLNSSIGSSRSGDSSFDLVESVLELGEESLHLQAAEREGKKKGNFFTGSKKVKTLVLQEEDEGLPFIVASHKAYFAEPSSLLALEFTPRSNPKPISSALTPAPRSFANSRAVNLSPTRRGLRSPTRIGLLFKK